jgi:N-acetylmuramoyl-L-alanine amidase
MLTCCRWPVFTGELANLPQVKPTGLPGSGRHLLRGGIGSFTGPLVAVLLVVSVGMLQPVGGPIASANANLSGLKVFIDPGHNGNNDSSTSRQVPAGRGGMKACNTTGAATASGYPEHALNWDVAVRVRDALDQQGVQTLMSRDSDTGVGPCVDERAARANAMHPDAIVSIHADGGPAAGRGFHVNYSSPPLNDAQSGPAVQLAHVMRDALVAAGMQPATYIGSNGLYGRADLAGLNLADFPAVLVELGNMKNADEASRMESADGRAAYAAAVVQIDGPRTCGRLTPTSEVSDGRITMLLASHFSPSLDPTRV